MVKKLALISGIALLFLGCLGFIPNPLIGFEKYFHTNWLQNILHLVLGGLLIMSSVISSRYSSTWLRISGLFLLLLFVNGLIDIDNLFGFIPSNMNDAWLHLALGILFTLMSFTIKPDEAKKPGPMTVDKMTM